MPPPILERLTLGYQLVWNQLRQPVAVQLFVDPTGGQAVDAAHLLAAIGQSWSEQSPLLLLCVQSPSLLVDLLQHTAPGGPSLAVPQEQLADAALAAHVRAAHRRGLQLLWRGAPGQQPEGDMADCFDRSVLSLTAAQALLCLRASLRWHQDDAMTPPSRRHSPVLPGQIYEAVPSRVLVEHCLDEQDVWGVAGWPTEDVLHGYRGRQIHSAHRAVVRLVEAIDADASTEVIEHALAEEPVLTYRFLRYANSAALGLRTSVDSLRHALMVLGLTAFRHWLLEQLPHAGSDLNLQPVRSAMVLRARLMELLLDAGEEDQLRSEVYLCGLLSQIDLLLGQPLADTLQRLPLSERIGDAVLRNNGPYAPFLEIASALEYPHMQAVPALCATHQLDLGEVNRALLRVLAHARPHPPRGRLLD
jgi:c-di-GMP phosphodiesterase